MKTTNLNKKIFLAGGIVAALALAAMLVFLAPQKKPERRTVPEYVPAGDVAAFHRDCIDNVLAGGSIPATCQSFESMKQAYGVDAEFLLDIEQGKMIMTARRIARGEIMTPQELEDCIDRGDCRKIPLIPAKFHGNEDVENSPKGMAVREVFWHLVNDGSLTPAMCAFLDICQAYVKLGLVSFNEAAEAP